MNKNCFIILPNQLFKESLFLKRDNTAFIIEEYMFFKQYNFHKQKISFHRATMKFYEDYLIEYGLNVKYINSFERESKISLLIEKIKLLGFKSIEVYDPVAVSYTHLTLPTTPYV